MMDIDLFEDFKKILKEVNDKFQNGHELSVNREELSKLNNLTMDVIDERWNSSNCFGDDNWNSSNC